MDVFQSVKQEICQRSLVSVNLTPVAPGQSKVCKVAQLQVVVV